MQPASDASVKGRFDGAQFRYDNVVSRFFQRDGRYWVRTDGPDGALTDFEIEYTFGVYPLQQYLVELPRGRIQALSIAWDTRPRNAGGQRWFHLYAGQGIAHGDELHWTGRQQNWNFMCADCHSTNVRKNYDAAGDSFQTTWSAIDVSCEACHGPGSRHVRWAQPATPSSSPLRGDNGLTVHLTERQTSLDDRRRDDETGAQRPRGRPRRRSTPARSVMLDGRRSPMATMPGRRCSISTSRRPSSRALFPRRSAARRGLHLRVVPQSRMAQAGVTCSDCHEPHTAKLQNNRQCALHEVPHPRSIRHPGASPSQATSTGAACVECHMPARTYMQIDARRDHSLRVPRPDLTLAMGTPNACTGCHTNRPAAWAATTVRAGWDATPRASSSSRRRFTTRKRVGPARWPRSSTWRRRQASRRSSARRHSLGSRNLVCPCRGCPAAWATRTRSFGGARCGRSNRPHPRNGRRSSSRC